MEVGPSRCAEIRTTPADHFQLPCPGSTEAIASNGRYCRDCSEVNYVVAQLPILGNYFSFASMGNSLLPRGKIM